MLVRSVMIGVVLLALSSFSFLWNPVPLGNMWLSHHLDWGLLIAQAFFFFAGAILTYRASFRSAIGGNIGKSVKCFSIGLLCLGIGVFQTPIIEIYDLWQTWYISSGLLYSIYLVSGIFFLLSLWFVARTYLRQTFYLLLIMLLSGILTRLFFSLIPFQPNTFYLTSPEYVRGVTIDTLLFFLAVTIIMFMFMLCVTFGQSVVGKIFRMQVIGFLWLLVPISFDLLQDFIPGLALWYHVSGVWILDTCMLGAAASFYYFGFFLENAQFV